MDINTKIEKDHYNKQQENIVKNNFIGFDWRYGSERLGPVIGMPFSFTEKEIEKIIKVNEKKGKKTRMLDYGCGIGLHAIFPAKNGAEVYGIDISDVSIEVAKKWASQEGIEDKLNFFVMDCEKIDFPDNYFDIVFNCGTLSCIDREKGYSEIIRVLKNDGYFISIDTIGYNPLLNINRRIKLMRGIRTKHTYDNILKMEDIIEAKGRFKNSKVYFFNLITLAAIPFQKMLGFKRIFKYIEKIDNLFLRVSILQKYAFKTVFIFNCPKK